MGKRDYYEILGVSKTATEQEIKTAYRSLAKKYHPDKLKDGTSDEKMKELNEAYSILSDPEKRKVYDQYGHDAANGRAGANPGGGNYYGGGFGGAQGFSEDFQDIFENIFGGFGGRRQRSSQGSYQQRGDDYRTNINISFMDALKGKTIKEKLDKWEMCMFCTGTGAENPNDLQTCSSCNGVGHKRRVVNSFFGQQVQQVVCETCHGKGKVTVSKCKKCRGEGYSAIQKTVSIKIEEGTVSGTRLKVAGYGGLGKNGGTPGDLYITVNVLPHKYYERDGMDIEMDFPVSFIDIMLENTVDVPTPWGNVKIKMKKTYTNSKVIKVPKKGVHFRGMEGDLRLHLEVIIPDLDRKNKKEVLAALQNVSDSSNQDFVQAVEKANK
ncbi:DnaJ C-terminal domain-containing protein [Mycoplasma sp. 4079]|uniref:DnaJ C-terminal domain-containing protein n=1 Tax=unclassified Mycoplasma TaxID=2683645 RepID=UPI0039FBB459